MKKVYIGMGADGIKPHHINLIKEATKLGEITIGLFTDELILKHEKAANFNYEQRKVLLENIYGVKNIVPQHSWNFTDNLNQIKPDYVTHSDDYQVGIQSKIRKHVTDTIKEWGGQWLEIVGIPSNTAVLHTQNRKELGITPERRLSYLRGLLDTRLIVRVLEVHNGLTGLIVEDLKINDVEGQKREFDAMWSSSLTESTARGKPDIEVVDITSRLETVNSIFDVTTKPMIFDADTGGKPEHFVFTVKSLERLGVSAVIIEDKVGLKKNSLFGNEVTQSQATIEEFCEKIRVGKQAQVTKDFMIIARIESLILDKGMEDALERAQAYIEAGADAIMIHSRKKEPDEIFTFCESFQNFSHQVPLVVVPSSYNKVTEQQLINAGVKIVIYANHMLRAAYPGMVKVAKSILQYSRSAESEAECMSIDEILELIPGTK